MQIVIYSGYSLNSNDEWYLVMMNDICVNPSGFVDWALTVYHWCQSNKFCPLNPPSQVTYYATFVPSKQ